MKTKATHTPGPWTLMDEHLQNEQTGDDFPMITAWDEEAEESVTVAVASPDADAMYANARFIVEACNNYEKVKAERDQLLVVCEEALRESTCNCGEVCIGTCTHSLLKAAIAKAKGD